MSMSLNIGKSDFKSETDRAAWVQKHGIVAYNALPLHAPLRSARSRSDFKSERQRAQFVNENGLAAYQALAD
ncbi:MAG: hypothetical protein QOK23_100 [Gammaproteobacteria bacterium]|jgi:hypothetical protein|nr:hypothetical protein [Gammaproteobacteria bacterium]